MCAHVHVCVSEYILYVLVFFFIPTQGQKDSQEQGEERGTVVFKDNEGKSPDFHLNMKQIF